VRKSERGFNILDFVDANGEACNLQESSAARDEGLIWLGCRDIGLKRFVPGQGWSDVPLEDDFPDGVSHDANTRMHLTQSQVRALLPYLHNFAEHGVLSESEHEGGISLQEFAKFLVAAMDMPADVRATTWPQWHAEEKRVHDRWLRETNQGKTWCKKDPMVQSWDSARFHWFELPKLREFVQ
jgi:hypothetical protein